MQYKNFLQFEVDGAADQLKKACKHRYDRVEKEETVDGKMSLCEAGHLHNCSYSGKSACMNPTGFMYNKDVCQTNNGQSILEHFLFLLQTFPLLSKLHQFSSKLAAKNLILNASYSRMNTFKFRISFESKLTCIITNSRQFFSSLLKVIQS